jgi:hypothetical protein
MSTDLTERIADLARQWETDAPTIALDELHTASAGKLALQRHSAVIELDLRDTRRGRLALILVSVAAIAVGLFVVLSRDPDVVDPAAPSTLPSIATSVPAAPVTTATTATATTLIPDTSIAPTTSTAGISPDAVASRLADIDAARADALRVFDTIGFTVRHVRVDPAGTVESESSADVVLRNDGSAAVVSDDFLYSYYDAAAGTARASFVDADGNTAYQELAGQSDSSVALGIPTGLPNGIVEPFPLMPDYVVDVADDAIDGRAAWRIDREYDMGDGSDPQTTSIWIDVETGVTLQTRSTGTSVSNGVPLTDTLTLSTLTIGAPMPADFPGSFPDGADVERSGDATQFGATSIEAAAVEFGSGVPVPSGPADVVFVSRMNFGNEDGSTTSSPSLVVRWLDGFLTTTEYRLTTFPPSMPVPDTCAPCTGTLLQELHALAGQGAMITVHRGNLGISITGPDIEAVRTVIDSLVESG